MNQTCLDRNGKPLRGAALHSHLNRNATLVQEPGCCAEASPVVCLSGATEMPQDKCKPEEATTTPQDTCGAPSGTQSFPTRVRVWGSSLLYLVAILRGVLFFSLMALSAGSGFWFLGLIGPQLGFLGYLAAVTASLIILACINLSVLIIEALDRHIPSD